MSPFDTHDLKLFNGWNYQEPWDNFCCMGKEIGFSSSKSNRPNSFLTSITARLLTKLLISGFGEGRNRVGILHLPCSESCYLWIQPLLKRTYTIIPHIYKRIKGTAVKCLTICARATDGWSTTIMDNKYCKVMLIFNPKNRCIAVTNFTMF